MRVSAWFVTAVRCAFGFLLASESLIIPGLRGWPAQQIDRGLSIRILSADIAKDGTIRARYRVTDGTGLPLDIAGKHTPGAIKVSHQAGYAPEGQTHFVSYSTSPPPQGRNPVTLGARDSGGKLEVAGPGEYVYTFRTKAPPGWDAAATHRIAVHGLRDLKPLGRAESVKYADTTFDFVPAGGTPKPPEIHRHCNSCHLSTQAAPDGSPRSEQLCIMCHTQMKCAS